MNGEALSDELVRLVQVLVEDARLRAWFQKLDRLPEGPRSVEFARVAAQMKAGHEDPKLVQATALLANPEVYKAVRLTLRDELARR